MSEYPEHEKMKAVRDRSQVIGQFLEWLFREQGLAVCEWREGPRVDAWERDSRNIEQLLAAYFDIDLKKVDDEKEAMLAVIRGVGT